MELAVIVVNWNTRDLLARCLCSVQSALVGVRFSWQVLVVDSASRDGSVEMVRERFPTVTLLELAENRGFGAAANHGLRFVSLAPRHPISPASASAQMVQGSGEEAGRRESPLPGYVFLLNADTEVVGTALVEMVSYLNAHLEAGVVGPRLQYPDGTVQPSRRRFPTLATMFWESTWLEHYFPGNPWARRYRVADRSDDEEQEVDWLVGACLLVRAEAIAQAGLLDEGYFLYFEELEWCQRIRGAGWRVVYLPAAQVIHHEGRSTEQVPLQRHLYFGWSKVRYARVTFGRGPATVLRYFLLGTYLWQLLVEGAKWLVGHRRPLRRERMEIYTAVLRNGLRGAPC